jgi:hypothetical protein
VQPAGDRPVGRALQAGIEGRPHAQPAVPRPCGVVAPDEFAQRVVEERCEPNPLVPTARMQAERAGDRRAITAVREPAVLRIAARTSLRRASAACGRRNGSSSVGACGNPASSAACARVRRRAGRAK